MQYSNWKLNWSGIDQWYLKKILFSINTENYDIITIVTNKQNFMSDYVNRVTFTFNFIYFIFFAVVYSWMT